MPRTRPAALVLIPILLAVTACDPSPGSTDAVSNSASPTSAAPVAALTRAAARADAKRLDAAVQTAYTAALGSQHDRSKLAAALASPELDRIIFFSRYLQEAKGTSTPRTITYRPERVYSPLADWHGAHLRRSPDSDPRPVARAKRPQSAVAAGRLDGHHP